MVRVTVQLLSGLNTSMDVAPQIPLVELKPAVLCRLGGPHPQTVEIGAVSSATGRVFAEEDCPFLTASDGDTYAITLKGSAKVRVTFDYDGLQTTMLVDRHTFLRDLQRSLCTAFHQHFPAKAANLEVDGDVFDDFRSMPFAKSRPDTLASVSFSNTSDMYFVDLCFRRGPGCQPAAAMAASGLLDADTDEPFDSGEANPLQRSWSFEHLAGLLRGELGAVEQLPPQPNGVNGSATTLGVAAASVASITVSAGAGSERTAAGAPRDFEPEPSCASTGDGGSGAPDVHLRAPGGVRPHG
mmetsp:Transcript_112195/g.312263  ORF Transcript_112195/g.312263 Transcript_112195/m.312263 type:complete len:298 (+) Transcript_112195:65-958(+)